MIRLLSRPPDRHPLPTLSAVSLGIAATKQNPRGRGEPVATVQVLPACAARCFCRHAADSVHSPWPEPCTFLHLCVALLRSEGMHRRLQDQFP